MQYREETLGRAASFLLPSLQLRQPPQGSDPTLEARLHAFLMERFGGYTAQAGNIFGYWREGEEESYGEHREFTVALRSEDQLPVLREFLADLSAELHEQ